MSNKIIFGAMYAAIGGLGLWLIIDVGGILAAIGGMGLILFAGAGLAGLVTFEPAPISGVNYVKKINSRGVTRAPRLDAIEFIRNELGVKLTVPSEIREAASLNGQIVAYHFDSPYNRPRVFDPHSFKPYRQPVSIIGELQVLLNYLRDIDDCNYETILSAIGVAYTKYHEDYEFYPIELIFNLSDEDIKKVRDSGDVQREKDDLRTSG